jgi:hypothetical protein
MISQNARGTVAAIRRFAAEPAGFAWLYLVIVERRYQVFE